MRLLPPDREEGASLWLCKRCANPPAAGMLKASSHHPWPALIGVSPLVSRHLRPVRPSDAEHELEIVLEASDAPVYNTAAVARRCRLPAATFQAWERRYGFPEPRRGPGRQRLYSERDVQAIRWLQARIAEGLTIQRGARTPPSAPQRSRRHRRSRARRSGGQTTRPSSLARRLERALLAFDRAQAGATLGEAFGLYPVEQVCLEVIQPTLHAIGLAWQAGTVGRRPGAFREQLHSPAADGAAGAQRRRGSDAVGRGRLRARRVARARPPDGGAVPRPSRLARRSTWAPSLPPDGLESRLRQLQPTAVVFSASTPQTATSLAAIVRRLTEPPTSATAGRLRRPRLRSRIRHWAMRCRACISVRTPPRPSRDWSTPWATLASQRRLSRQATAVCAAHVADAGTVRRSHHSWDRAGVPSLACTFFRFVS